jgi:hypothetical protein
MLEGLKQVEERLDRTYNIPFVLLQDGKVLEVQWCGAEQCGAVQCSTWCGELQYVVSVQCSAVCGVCFHDALIGILPTSHTVLRRE